MKPTRQTSALAITSLVSGILGWTLLPFLGALVAIITGHMARREIRAANGRLGWVAMALTLVTLFIVFAFLGGLAWFAALNS